MKLLLTLRERYVEIAGVVSFLSLIVAYFYLPERLTPEERLARSLKKARAVLMSSPDYAYDLLNESPNVRGDLQRRKEMVMRMAQIFAIKSISEGPTRITSLTESFLNEYARDHEKMHEALADVNLTNSGEIASEHRYMHAVLKHATSVLMKYSYFELAESLANRAINAGIADDEAYAILCDVHSLIGMSGLRTPEESYTAAIESARKIRDFDVQLEYEMKVNARFGKHTNVLLLFDALKKADNVRVLAKVSHIAAGSSVALGRPEDAMVTSWLLFNILNKIHPADRSAYIKNATAAYVIALRSAGHQVPEQMFGAIRGLAGAPAIAAGLYELEHNPEGGLYLLEASITGFDVLPIVEFGITHDDIFRTMLRYAQKTNDPGEIQRIREIWSRLDQLQPVNSKFVLGRADLYAAEARIYLERKQNSKYEDLMAQGGYFILQQLDRLLEIRDAERSAYLKRAAELLEKGNCIVRAVQVFRQVYEQNRNDVAPMVQAVSLFLKNGIVNGESPLEYYGLGATQFVLRDVDLTSPLLVDIALMRARLFRLVGDSAKAIQAYEEVREDARYSISPLSPSLYFPGTLPWAESLLEEAEIMWEQYRMGSVGNVEDHFRKIGTLLNEYRERYVMNPDARQYGIQADKCFMLLAKLSIAKNDFKAAIENLEFSTKLEAMKWEKPDRWRTYYMLAALHFREERFQDAYKNATLAISMAPERHRWQCLALRAKINEALKNTFEAKLDSEKSVEEKERFKQ